MKEGAVEQYPPLQKVQRMLDVVNRTIKEEEHQDDPGVRGRASGCFHISYASGHSATMPAAAIT